VIFEGVGRSRLGTHIVPEPPPGFLRIRIAACGVCQREWHVLRGNVPRAFPTVMGHEPVGIVDAVGADVSDFCLNQWVTGVGGASLADYDLVDARFTAALTRPPAQPETALGEPVMCAVNAVNRLPLTPNAKVVVNGAGFMGNLLVQVLRRKSPSTTVVALDPDHHARHSAIAAGASCAEANPAVVRDVLGGRADIVIEASGARGTVATSTDLVRNGGTLALFAHHFQVEPTVVNEWHMRGITVLNTVPWAAPDLGLELREAVDLINGGAIQLPTRRVRVITPYESVVLLNRALTGADTTEPSEKLIVRFA
jgi:threonine dehydrogenase-like Zn-dependent dehydrogenase